MKTDMMAYNIWIIAASIFKVVLDLKIWIKFFNSNYISQSASKLQIQCQAAKQEYKSSFVRNKEQ